MHYKGGNEPMEEKSTFEGKSVKGIANYYWKHTKNTKGITLIALVVTIIVLLILAAVTITIALRENSIITQEINAKKLMDIAEVKENARLDITNWIIGRLKNGQETTLDDKIVKSIIEEANKYNTNKYYSELTDTTIITKQGNEVLLSELYNKSEKEEKTGILASEKLVIDEENKITPYVNYIDKNGQKILCRVLYDASSEYGLQIVSDTVVGEVTLGGKERREYETSFKRSIHILNEHADKYLNEKISPINGARTLGTKPDDPNRGETFFDYKGIYYFTGILSVSEEDSSQMGKLHIWDSDVSFWYARFKGKSVWDDGGNRKYNEYGY